MNILEREFDRSALDTYDAEPEIREITLKALGDRETAAVEEIIRWMGRPDWVLCWLTKLGVPHVKMVEMAKNICLPLRHYVPDNHLEAFCECLALVGEWTKEQSRINASAAIRGAAALKDIDLPLWVKCWPILAAMTITNHGLWLHRPEKTENEIRVPHNTLYRRMTESIIKDLGGN